VELCYFCVQQLRKMATARSYGDMLEAFIRRGNLPEMFISSLNNITSECNFDSVKFCLAMGPGTGFCEVGFVEKCTPNITKFVAIERDHELAERLKVCLRKRLPDVEGLVIESNFNTWNGPSNQVDLVLAFHVLYSIYYSGAYERRMLLKKVHDCYLTDGGFLAVLSAAQIRSKSPEIPVGVLTRLGSLTPWEEIEADILNVGFVKQHAHDIQVRRDFSNPDEDFLRFFLDGVVQPVTLDDVRKIIKEQFPDGKVEDFERFAVYKKAF